MKILEKNGSVAEMKNAFSDFASRFKIAGKRANELENGARSIEITQSETQMRKTGKNKQKTHRTEHSKKSNIHVI